MDSKPPAGTTTNDEGANQRPESDLDEIIRMMSLVAIMPQQTLDPAATEELSAARERLRLHHGPEPGNYNISFLDNGNLIGSLLCHLHELGMYVNSSAQQDLIDIETGLPCQEGQPEPPNASVLKADDSSPSTDDSLVATLGLRCLEDLYTDDTTKVPCILEAAFDLGEEVAEEARIEGDPGGATGIVANQNANEAADGSAEAIPHLATTPRDKQPFDVDIAESGAFDRDSLRSIVDSIPPEVQSLQGLLAILTQQEQGVESPDLSAFREALSTLVNELPADASNGQPSWVSGRNLTTLSLDLWDVQIAVRERSIDEFTAKIQERINALPQIRPRPSTGTEISTNNSAQVIEKGPKAGKKRGSYIKEEKMLFPKRLLDRVDPAILIAQKKIWDAMNEAKKKWSKMQSSQDQIDKAEKGPRGSYACNLCGSKLGLTHECPFVRIPRQELEQIRDHIPSLPQTWIDILDVYRDRDRILLERDSERSGSNVDRKPAAKHRSKDSHDDPEEMKIDVENESGRAEEAMQLPPAPPFASMRSSDSDDVETDEESEGSTAKRRRKTV